MLTVQCTMEEVEVTCWKQGGSREGVSDKSIEADEEKNNRVRF